MAILASLPNLQGVTVGADKYYDHGAFVRFLQQGGAEPHVGRKRRRSMVDEAITLQPGYVVSQRLRKLVEQIFGWTKTVGLLRKKRHRGRKRVAWVWTFTMAAYNLVSMRNLRLATSP